MGWEFVHVCIGDASRIAFSKILPDERKESEVAFLAAAVAYYASLGVIVIPGAAGSQVCPMPIPVPCSYGCT